MYTICDFHNFCLIFAGQCTMPQRGQRSEKKFQKTLILVFEVIVQPRAPNSHFLAFSSETKIMKITHSESAYSCLLRWGMLCPSASVFICAAVVIKIPHEAETRTIQAIRYQMCYQWLLASSNDKKCATL